MSKERAVLFILFCFSKVKHQDHIMSCADPDSDSQRGDNVFYSFFHLLPRGDDPTSTKAGNHWPRQRKWQANDDPKLKAGLVVLRFFRVSKPVLLRNPIDL